MSKSQSKTSPARSEGILTPRRSRTRRTRSTASPARSGVSGRLTSVVDNFVQDDFVLSPMRRRSVLPDDTEIKAPRRASWWKRLEGSSRDVLEALDTNKMTDELLVEEYEFEVEKDKQNQSVPESSDGESLASIVVPQRRLFNQKKQPQSKFADVMGSRKSLGKTNLEDQSIEEAPKNLFNKGPRNKPVFPAALLNSTNKTINKTVEPEPNKKARPNLFGQAGTKRKNMFADFVLSDSEEDSEVQHKLFGFKKNNNKRISLGTRNRRMPSLTPSMTTETDIDDWYLLPSSTMIGTQEVSKLSIDDVAVGAQEENQDDTLTEANESLNSEAKEQSTHKNSIIQDDNNDKTLTNENIEDDSNTQDIKTNESKKNNKTHERSKSKLNVSVKDKTLLNKSTTRDNAENEEIIEEAIVEKQQNNAGTKPQITVMKIVPSLEDKIAELHGESVDKEESQQNILLNITKENLENYKDTEPEKKCEQEIKPSAEQQEVQNVSKVASNVHQDDDLPENVIFSGKQLERTRNDEAQKSRNGTKDASNIKTKENVENNKDTETENKGEQEIKPSAEQQEVQNVSKVASNVNQDDDLPENVIFSGKHLERTRNYEAQKSRNGTKDASNINQDEDMVNVCEKDTSAREIEPTIGKQESQAHSPGEASNTNQNEDMEDEREEEIESSAEEKETPDHSEEGSQTNQDEVMNDISENDKSEEESEPSDHDEENQDDSKEESHESEDEEMDDVSEKDKSRVNNQESHNDLKEQSYENEEEDMEEMVWNDNVDEKASDTLEATMNATGKQNDEVAPGEKDNKTVENDRTLERKDINKSSNLTNKSQKIVESLVDNDQIEEDVVDETTNNSTHDTTGRNRKKETIVKSPEAVLQNMTTDNESFRPIGRSTTFRKSKSLYDTMNRRSLAPVQESTLGSEGSRSSSTEGSEWDSHRTTRKTIRQTLGKEYTTRKSMRALVMEQSAKRQTELYSKNTSNINKTKNKSGLERNDKNASKLNKTKNKTVLDEANKTATVDKANNKTVSEDVNNKNASTMNKTKNKTVLEDINDQHIRFRRTSNRDLSSSMQLQSPIPKSPVHGTSSHHVLDPLILEHQVSYHKSLHDIKYPEISEQISNREDSINIPVVENNDSGPEISMNASYGQGMSADTAHDASLEETEASYVEMKENSSLKGMEDKEIPRRNASVRPNSIHSSDQEVLDYEASELEKSDQDISDNEVDQDNVEQNESVQDEEKDNSEPEESENEDAEESEQENEDSQQEMEVESEHGSHQDIDEEYDHEESQQEIESEPEKSQIEIEPESDQEESEQENEESQQEIEAESEHESQQEIEESEHEESQQEIESEQEESQQEIEPESDQEESQQDIESEQEESQQEVELASEQESDNEERDNSQPESDQEIEKLSREPEKDSEDENEDFVSGVHSQYRATNSRVSRVVFDSQMMSEEEIDFGGISRQTENDISEQSERELSRSTLPRVSQPSVHNISVATKRSMLMMEMQKVAQKNAERKQKIRDYVQNVWLKPPPPGCRSPEPEYSIPRKIKQPRQPKNKTKRTGFPLEVLPKAFVEDLKYKPPKRFMPAPWTTKRLYKFIETKLEPKYDYRARVRAEDLVRSIYSFCKLVRRRDVAPPQAVDELKREMARLKIVDTHFDFYEFMFDYLPREVRIKVVPNVVNKIPMPRNGIYGQILQSRAVVE